MSNAHDHHIENLGNLAGWLERMNQGPRMLPGCPGMLPGCPGMPRDAPRMLWDAVEKWIQMEHDHELLKEEHLRVQGTCGTLRERLAGREGSISVQNEMAAEMRGQVQNLERERRLLQKQCGELSGLLQGKETQRKADQVQSESSLRTAETIHELKAALDVEKFKGELSEENQKVSAEFRFCKSENSQLTAKLQTTEEARTTIAAKLEACVAELDKEKLERINEKYSYDLCKSENSQLSAKLQAAEQAHATIAAKLEACVTDLSKEKSERVNERHSYELKLQKLEMDLEIAKNKQRQMIEKFEGIEAEHHSMSHTQSHLHSSKQAAACEAFSPAINIYDTKTDHYLIRTILLETPGVVNFDCEMVERGIKITFEKLKCIDEAHVFPIRPIQQTFGIFEETFPLDNGAFEISEEESKLEHGILQICLKKALCNRKFSFRAPPALHPYFASGGGTLSVSRSSEEPLPQNAQADSPCTEPENSHSDASWQAVES